MDEYTDMFFKSGPGEYLKQAPKRIVVEGKFNLLLYLRNNTEEKLL